MIRTMVFAAGLAVSVSLAAATVVFGEEMSVGEIKVSVEFDAVDANALEYWPTIAEDLQTALQARAMPFRAEDGVDISVKLGEVSVSGSRILSGEGEFNRIGGWVYFRTPGTEAPFEQENIVLDASTLRAGIGPEGLTIPDRPVFYTALLDGFALATLDRLADNM